MLIKTLQLPIFILLALCHLNFAQLVTAEQSNTKLTSKPNIVLIYADDQGWQEVALVYPDASAYTDLEVTDDNQMVCLYENGINSPYERISLHFIPLEKVLSTDNGKAKP